MTNLTTNFQENFSKELQLALNTELKKTSILLWTNQSPKNSFVLKKDGKKYLGLLRKDKKGETYWKFKEIRKKSNSLESNLVADKVEQFNQRQEKVKNYANNINPSKE